MAGAQDGGWMTRGEKEAGWKRTNTGAILGLDQAPYKGSVFEVPPQANVLRARTLTHVHVHVHTHTFRKRHKK